MHMLACTQKGNRCLFKLVNANLCLLVISNKCPMLAGGHRVSYTLGVQNMIFLTTYNNQYLQNIILICAEVFDIQPPTLTTSVVKVGGCGIAGNKPRACFEANSCLCFTAFCGKTTAMTLI